MVFPWFLPCFLLDAIYNGALNLEVNGSLPSDSKCPNFIPDRWRSRFHPLKGFTFSPSQKGHKELPGRGSFTLWKTPASFILEKSCLNPWSSVPWSHIPRSSQADPLKKSVSFARSRKKNYLKEKKVSFWSKSLYYLNVLDVKPTIEIKVLGIVDEIDNYFKIMVVWTPKNWCSLKTPEGYVIAGTVKKPHSSSCGVFCVVGCPKRYVARSFMRLMRGEDARPQNHPAILTPDKRSSCFRKVGAVGSWKQNHNHCFKKNAHKKKKRAKTMFLLTGWKCWVGHPFLHGKKMTFIGGVQLKLGWLSSSRQVGLPVTPDFF